MSDKITAGLSYSTSGATALFGYVTAQHLGVLVGIVCAIVTAAASVWAKVRRDRREAERDRREAELHRVQLAHLERGQ